MEKLPSTSYVRLVDIWLICGQLIPFIEVILLTVRELYNEDYETNHHGFVRRVGSISQVNFQFLVCPSSCEVSVSPLYFSFS
jgi:hypothetical protein